MTASFGTYCQDHLCSMQPLAMSAAQAQDNSQLLWHVFAPSAYVRSHELSPCLLTTSIGDLFPRPRLQKDLLPGFFRTLSQLLSGRPLGASYMTSCKTASAGIGRSLHKFLARPTHNLLCQHPLAMCLSNVPSGHPCTHPLDILLAFLSKKRCALRGLKCGEHMRLQQTSVGICRHRVLSTVTVLPWLRELIIPINGFVSLELDPSRSRHSAVRTSAWFRVDVVRQQNPVLMFAFSSLEVVNALAGPCCSLPRDVLLWSRNPDRQSKV